MTSKSRARPQRKRQPNQLAELGLFDIPNLDAADDSSDDSEIDESALESELEALLSGKGARAPTRPNRPKAKVAQTAGLLDIDKILKTMDEDDDDDDDDDDKDLSGDEDLMNELQTITTEETPHDEKKENEPSESILPERKQSSHAESPNSISVLLEERLALYNLAINVAKENGDSSKVRRYGRAKKTLEDLIKSAKSGASINEEDIPPIVKIPKSVNADTSKSSDKPPMERDLNDSNVCESVTDTSGNINNVEEQKSINTSKGAPLTRSELITRRNQYKVAALQAKREGNKNLALNCLKTVKTFDAVIEAIDNNLPVDLSNVPPAPRNFCDTIQTTEKSSSQHVDHDEVQMSSDIAKAALAAANEPEEPELFAAPPPPATILEALEQRLEKYSATKQAAEVENNSQKVRRLQRIIKQYETAIKDYKAGKFWESYEELPVPPGFAPIPVPNEKPTKPGESSGNAPMQSKISGNSNNKNPPQAATNTNTHAVKKPKVQRTNTSTVGEKQLEFLLERQKLFRQAALAAKQNGDIQQAKEYLRMSKGFDSMIEATKCGLPIDASTIPTPPQLESDFVIVDVSECTENANYSQEELLDSLEKDLSHQIELCTRNKEHFLRLGDVSSASKFEKLCLESKKDLTVIRHLKTNGQPAPRFHYETRLFSMVLCHTDLGDNDLHVSIERGINLPGKPNDLDSYIRLEFPIPQEAPQRAKTHTVRDTNNPVFEEEFKFEFNRKSRSQLRQFKRQALKLELWSKGGFLSRDSLLGTVNIKLVDFESKCLIHDSFNLMDGRKACGGKLEVKVRIRDPLLVKQVEEVREKWLVIGS
ncbi:coiled-coil and C2 domain-containing protein 1-like [Nephila pilipes]|uniref:Coiled-coil and C2 domain-containing protein 1-like n=1 Tax=Nephila pilipes TaxID=299642 RepID=A0A8X6NUN7_NEPPI|nr:coiled-coil and C2 domain-containing protein 1-like [Nephila pilipes]